MEKKSVVVFGCDITGLSKTRQFVILSSGALISSLGFAYLQEKVTTLPGFHYYDFMTFLTTLTFTLCGFVERYTTNDFIRKAKLSDYFLLSMCTLGGMYFTNQSLKYLNYTTRIVFKSSKVIPVMLMGVVMQGKKYISLEYVSVFILVIGIIFFTLGDANETPNYNPLGLILITIGVILDAVTANYEEKNFFHGKNCSPAEVMMFASLFGALSSFVGLLLQNDWTVLEYISEHPQVVYHTVCFSTLGYSSSLFILLLIKNFSATNAEIVKSLRKILSIAISFIAFTKPFTLFHFYGSVLFVVSTLLGIQVTRAKSMLKKEKNTRDKEELKPLSKA